MSFLKIPASNPLQLMGRSLFPSISTAIVENVATASEVIQERCAAWKSSKFKLAREELISDYK